MHIVKRLCKLKYRQEITRHEVDLIKRRIPMHLSRHQCASSPLLDSITDPHMRQQLLRQYMDAAEQARTRMMADTMECADTQMRQCAKQFDAAIKDMWHGQRSLPFDQRLTKVMCELIEQRLTNIHNRLERVYALLTHQLLLEANDQ